MDPAGAKVSSFQYEPFGATTGIGLYPAQFTGRLPVTSGLYYNRARFYNSATGRFISEDPVGLSRGLNLYRYVANNPMMAIDPTGLFCVYYVSQHYLFCEEPGGSFGSTNVYSGGGINNTNPGCRNNPACESQQNVGPLPGGSYTIGSNQGSDQYPWIPLTAQPGTPTYGGRSGFYFHCQGPLGSEGCIAVQACSGLANTLGGNVGDTVYIRP